MQSTILKEEKHSKNGNVAFLVDITTKENNKQLANQNLEVKKRLESEAK